MVRERQKQILASIKSVFDSKLNNLTKKIDIFNCVINRYFYYKNIHCDKDIDILDRIIQLKKLNTKIHKLDLNTKGKAENITNFNTINIGSLKHSLFIEDPTSAISKSLYKYDFLPLSEKYLAVLKNVFINSTTVSEDYITNELLVVLPKIKSGVLLYRISRDTCEAKVFHELCDNKGKLRLK